MKKLLIPLLLLLTASVSAQDEKKFSYIEIVAVTAAASDYCEPQFSDDPRLYGIREGLRTNDKFLRHYQKFREQNHQLANMPDKQRQEHCKKMDATLDLMEEKLSPYMKIIGEIVAYAEICTQYTQGYNADDRIKQIKTIAKHNAEYQRRYQVIRQNNRRSGDLLTSQGKRFCRSLDDTLDDISKEFLN